MSHIIIDTRYLYDELKYKKENNYKLITNIPDNISKSITNISND